MTKYIYNTETQQILLDDGNLGKSFQHEPWVEITKTKANTILLQEAKDKKIDELSNFHFQNPSVRSGTINNTIPILFTKEFRDTLREQIQKLDVQIEFGLITEENASFVYYYGASNQAINHSQLKQLLIVIMNIVDSNFVTYQLHINAINNFATIEEVENFDYTQGYLLNQNINMS